MMQPLISVLIRTINRPFMLAEAIDSVLLQTYPNIEIIVVNDGGPAVSKQLADLHTDLTQVKIIDLPQTIGRSAAGNLALDHATGDLVNFLDDDDILYPQHCALLQKAMVETNSSVVYGLGICAKQIICPFDPRVYLTVDLLLEKGKSFSHQALLSENFLPLNTVLFEHSAAAGLRFDSNLDVLEDWDFWLNLAKGRSFTFIDQITSEYRMRLDNSNTTGSLLDHIWWYSREYLQKKHPDLLYKAKRI